MPINENLLSDTIRQFSENELRVFAYGSLMWNPGFAHQSAKLGRIYGYHRRLAVTSTYYRGTPDFPGLVFGLDIGGSCNGIVFRIAKRNKAATIRYLFEREMFDNIYTPRRLIVNTDGKRYAVLSFVARRDGPRYVPPLSENEKIRIIRTAAGHAGYNDNYIHQTHRKLTEFGVICPALSRLCQRLKQGVK